jgi:hypothetical protein
VIDSAIEILQYRRRLLATMFYRKRSNFQRLKARKRELNNGIKVDDDGYVIPVDLLKDLEARGRKASYGS